MNRREIIRSLPFYTNTNSENNLKFGESCYRTTDACCIKVHCYGFIIATLPLCSH